MIVSIQYFYCVFFHMSNVLKFVSMEAMVMSVSVLLYYMYLHSHGDWVC